MNHKRASLNQPKQTFTDVKDRLERIETLLSDNQKLLKKSQRSSRYYHIDSIGLTGMVAGMGLVVAKPEFSTQGLLLFFFGFIISIVSHFLAK